MMFKSFNKFNVYEMEPLEIDSSFTLKTMCCIKEYFTQINNPNAHEKQYKATSSNSVKTVPKNRTDQLKILHHRVK